MKAQAVEATFSPINPSEGVQNEPSDSRPKIAPLPGFLQADLVRCGKPNCRCARGQRHGPYWYRRWHENGREHRQYIKAADVEAVRAACLAYRRQQRERRQTTEAGLAQWRKERQRLKDLLSTVQEVEHDG